MTLPNRARQTFLPSEIFFLAEDTPVDIIPRQSMKSIKVIGESIPQLVPMRRTSVPLWVAVLLKKQGRCNIVSPDWLNEENLKKVASDEARHADRFSDLPWHWMEISQSLLAVAGDDIPSPTSVVRSLLKDIREARQAKARAGLVELNESHMQMDNLGAMEINEIRPFVGLVMDQMRRVRSLTEETGEENEDEIEDDNDEF
jgi:GINS complex subunit 2